MIDIGIDITDVLRINDKVSKFFAFTLCRIFHSFLALKFFIPKSRSWEGSIAV